MMAKEPPLPLLPLLAFCAACLAGCERSPESHLEALQRELDRTVQETRKTIDQLRPQERATEEVEKLFVFEYRVFTAPGETSPDELEGKLNELGRERWECFDTERVIRGGENEKKKEEIRVFCKRRPKSYLRYIPRLVP